MLESSEYQDILKSVEKYRLEIIKLWNRKISNQLQKIIKKDIDDYSVYLIDNRLEILENPTISSQKLNVIILGKKIPENEPSKLIIAILESILKKELNTYKGIDGLIADAIIEMAIENELATIITSNSHYWLGNEKLINIKRQIYPFWLMYLGVTKENMIKYMNRDKISFDVEKFPYEKRLKDIDISLVANTKIVQDFSKIENLYARDNICKGQLVIEKQFDTKENLKIYEIEEGKEKVFCLGADRISHGVRPADLLRCVLPG